MADKPIPFNAKDRSIEKVLDDVRAYLSTIKPNEIESIFVRINRTTEDGNDQLYLIQAGLDWEDIGMLSCEIDIIRHEQYSAVMEAGADLEEF